MSGGDLVFRHPADLEPGAIQFATVLCDRFEDRIRGVLRSRGQPAITPFRADDGWKVRAATDRASCRIRESLQVHVVVSPDDPVALDRALNSKAPGLQIDFDDAHCPSWANTIRAQRQLAEFCNSERFHAQSPVLGFRPRSLHIPEPAVLYRGAPSCGSLTDLALFVANNAAAWANKDAFPVFYFAKIESFEEAAIWADIVRCAEQCFPALNVRSIAMLENIRAAFQIDAIVFTLRESLIAVNLGRYDYAFSFVKQFPDQVVPPRAKIGSQPFMRHCLALLVTTCGRRGVIPTTGMWPSLNPTSSNLKAAFESKRMEASFGSHGALVAHLDFVEIVREAFAEIGSPCTSSLGSLSETAPFEGAISADDVRQALRVVLHLCHSWLGGQGTAEVDFSMEDLATAELSRALVWQWCRAKLFDLGAAVDIVHDLSCQERCSSTAAEIVVAAIERDPIVPYLTDLLLPIVQKEDLSG